MPGIRDEALLESAVAAPQATMMGQPLIQDPIEVAASYLFYLCRNHPFVDGNKRVALATCLVVFSENGLLPSEALDADAWERLTLDMARAGWNASRRPSGSARSWYNSSSYLLRYSPGVLYRICPAVVTTLGARTSCYVCPWSRTYSYRATQVSRSAPAFSSFLTAPLTQSASSERCALVSPCALSAFSSYPCCTTRSLPVAACNSFWVFRKPGGKSGSPGDTGGVEIKAAEVKVDGVAESLAVAEAAR